jgi:uncharacterized protein (DUF983 family)
MQEENRSLLKAISCGLKQVCPQCGLGNIFTKYTTVAPSCSICHLDFSGHRADDAPPYLVILLAGHIIVPLISWVELKYAPSLLFELLLWLPFTVLLCILLLPRAKGLVIAWQWAMKMHGFGDKKT